MRGKLDWNFLGETSVMMRLFLDNWRKGGEGQDANGFWPFSRGFGLFRVTNVSNVCEQAVFCF